MKAVNPPVSYYLNASMLAKCAGVAFAVNVFFIFFGTSKPFPESLPDTGSSNINNQLLSLVYLTALISLWGKQDEVFTFIRKEKFFTMLMLWALISVSWSGDTMISLKRWIGLFGEAIVCLAAMLHFKWSEVALRYMRAILLLYLPLTILSVLFVHGAIQWEFPAWRGLEDTKNNLGQVAIFSTIIILAIISYHKDFKSNLLHFMLLGCSIACLMGSRSTTSMMIGAFLLVILGAMNVGRLFRSGHVAIFYGAVLLLGGLAIALIVSLFAPEILQLVFDFLGKDMTFTGRVELWQTTLAMTEGKALKGWGLGGYWIMDSAHLIPVFEQFVWIPNQSHQGYIDVYNQLGIVGLGLLVCAILNYFVGLSKLQKKHVWKWIFIGLIILNFQESAFLRPRHFGNFLFVFCYIALFTDLIKEKRNTPLY